MSEVQLDVVIPALREETLDDALWSIAHGTVKPALVTIVSNEVAAERETYGLDVRVIRFRSAAYPVGDGDLALKRNIGIWASPCSHVMTFDDDQVAPASLVETTIELLDREAYVWGHHRFVNYGSYGREQLLELGPERGAQREQPPNAWHFWLSCYGGLFAARRTVVLDVGGYDMRFCGRYGGEDQDFGRRLANAVDNRDMIFVHEPPFAWHPTERLGVPPRAWSNLCDEHRLVAAEIDGVAGSRCSECPYLRLDDPPKLPDQPLVPYNDRLVALEILDV